MLTLGWGAGTLVMNLRTGQVFAGRIEYRTLSGEPLSWPAGMAAWLRLSRSGFEAIWPATVDTDLMFWAVPVVQVDVVPSDAWAELWLQYQGETPFVWQEGPVQACAQPGFGYTVAVPAAGQGAVAVPSPALP